MITTLLSLHCPRTIQTGIILGEGLRVKFIDAGHLRRIAKNGHKPSQLLFADNIPCSAVKRENSRRLFVY